MESLFKMVAVNADVYYGDVVWRSAAMQNS